MAPEGGVEDNAEGEGRRKRRWPTYAIAGAPLVLAATTVEVSQSDDGAWRAEIDLPRVLDLGRVYGAVVALAVVGAFVVLVVLSDPGMSQRLCDVIWALRGKGPGPGGAAD